MSAGAIYQGTDISITISLTNKITSEAINIDNLAELFLYILLKDNPIPLKKYSKAGGGDYIAFKKIDSYNYRADWKSVDTSAASSGSYRIEVNVVETDTDFDDNEKNSVGTDDVIDLRKSVIKAESS
ncbi:MAG TPA: hypothetical protein VMV77_12740 [Bacteroidales bacterium]|nr:hypothetical protein [archaeon]HUX57837.1 hypothetical protein [Bacteroidales bacterium]